MMPPSTGPGPVYMAGVLVVVVLIVAIVAASAAH